MMLQASFSRALYLPGACSLGPLTINRQERAMSERKPQPPDRSDLLGVNEWQEGQ